MEIPSVGEIISGEVRKQILEGIYASGDRLNVDELARKLNTSKTPIREALGRLESEGLVSFRPRVGWSISALSMREFVDFLELQCALRYFVTDSLSPHRDKLDFDLLNSINKKLPPLSAEHKYLQFIKQNDLFHMTVFAVHPNQVILRRLEKVDAIIRLQRVRFFEQEKEFFPAMAQYAFEQHEEIIAALRGGNPSAIAEVSRKHHDSILNAYKNIAEGTVALR